MAPNYADVVIVGTGHGGAHTAIALRQQGFKGSVLMIGRDTEPPYERPPLSKDYLAGEKPFERIFIRPPTFWAEMGIELLLQTTVAEVNPANKNVILSSGEAVGYGNLVWAAGGDPRRLACPGAELAGIHAVRDRGDVDRIKAELAAGARKVVVVGGGYIGLEAAAVLTKLGCEVTVVEALPRVLARVAGKELSEFFQNEHRSHGVDIRLEESVASIEGVDSKVSAARLENGQILPCEMVVVGIGIVPAVEPLASAGATQSNGVVVDSNCRTDLPDIYAIGDCATHVSRFADGAMIRLESVQNAHDMAVTAAKSICGKPEPYNAIPWFWSNQFDLRLQTIGISAGHDEVIVRGDPIARSFSVLYLKGQRLIALDCVNSVKDYVQGRALIMSKQPIDPKRLTDMGTSLKELAA